MAVLQLNDKQFPLSATTTRIGAGADAMVKYHGICHGAGTLTHEPTDVSHGQLGLSLRLNIAVISDRRTP